MFKREEWGLFLLIFLIPLFLAGAGYKVGRRDVLKITIWNHPELSVESRVNIEGKIQLPLLGEVKVEGLTCEEIRDILTEKYRKDFVKDPQIFVSVKEFNSQKVMVLGSINEPGEYVLKGETRLLEILSQAGGIPPEGSKAKVIIMRRSQGEGESTPITVNLYEIIKKGNWKENILLKPGDIIYVSGEEVPSIHIMGEIKKPGSYPWKEGLTAFKAVLLAGGFTENASKKIKVIRGEKTLIINVKAILKGSTESDILLKPGDIIYVPMSWF